MREKLDIKIGNLWVYVEDDKGNIVLQPSEMNMVHSKEHINYLSEIRIEENLLILPRNIFNGAMFVVIVYCSFDLSWFEILTYNRVKLRLRHTIL